MSCVQAMITTFLIFGSLAASIGPRAGSTVVVFQRPGRLDEFEAK
jgi:hypothetical protein